MKSRINILLVCILIASLFYVPPVSAGDTWHGHGLYEEFGGTQIFGNPGYSSKPDFIFNSLHNMQVAWIDTYNKGLFLPAYAKFNGFSWHSLYGDDTHSVPVSLNPWLFNTFEAESVSKVMIAPSRYHPPSQPSVLNEHPVMIAGWIFNDEDFKGRDLFYVDLNDTYPQWKPVSPQPPNSWQNKTSFDVCYSNDYIYATWLEYTGDPNDDRWYYQIFASRYSYEHKRWEPLQNDTQIPGVTSTQMTFNEGNKFSPKIEIGEHADPNYDMIPYICWEEDGEVMMGKWEPSPSVANWVNLKGEEVDYTFFFFTNTSNTPKESLQPDFKLDGFSRPIVIWCEENTLNNTLEVVCTKWSGGSWWNYNSQPGFSSVANTSDIGDASEPKLDLTRDDYPVVTWYQHVKNDNSYVSLITVRDAHDFNKLNGSVGYSFIHPFSFNSTTECIPYIVSREVGIPPNVQIVEDIVVMGVTAPPVRWFTGGQTDIFFQRFVTRHDRDKRLTIRARKIAGGSTYPLNRGWFPIAGDQIVTYHVRLTDDSKPYLYIRFNTEVQLTSSLYPHHIESRNGDTGPFQYHPILTPLTWIKILVPYTVPPDVFQVGFNVQYSSVHMPTAMPQFYYTEAFTSFDSSPDELYADRNIFDPTAQHDFIGLNVPYDHDYLTVNPSFAYLNACNLQFTFFKIVLKSPWGTSDFEYELSIDNWDEMSGLIHRFRNRNGESIEGRVDTWFAVRADCDAPATWFTPRIKATLRLVASPTYAVYDTEEIKLLVRKPKIFAKKTANTSMASVGDIVHYTITVGNKGSGSAYGIEVTDIMPHDLEFLHSNIPGVQVGTSVVFYFDEIPPGTTYQIRIACRIKENNHIKAGDVITNKATVTGLEEELSTNMAITIKTTTPGCEMPEVELVIKNIGKGNIIRAGEEFECEMLIHSGCNPFDVQIFWDDNTKTDHFEIGESMSHTLTHTFNNPGDYLIRASVSDEFGKLVNLYKHVHVLSK